MNQQIVLDIAHPVIRDHQVHGQHLMPGLAYVDLLYQFAAQQGYEASSVSIRNVTIFSALTVQPAGCVALTIDAELKKVGVWHVVLRDTLKSGCDPTGPTRYATAEILEESPFDFNERLDVDAIRNDASNILASEEIYREARRNGLTHGPFMMANGTAYVTDDAIYADVRVLGEALENADALMYHPTLLDGCAVLIGGALSRIDDRPKTLSLPLSWESFRATEPLTARCIARMRRSSLRVVNNLSYLSIEFFREDGLKVAEMRNLACLAVDKTERLSRQDSRPYGANGHSVPPGDKTRSAEKMLRDLLSVRMGRSIESIRVDKRFAEKGLTSIDLLELVTAIEAWAGEQLPPTLLFEYTTVNEVAQYLDNLKALRTASSTPDAPLAAPPYSPPHSSEEAIAIIGFRGRFPEALTLDELWENLRSGRDSVVEIPSDRWSASEYLEMCPDDPDFVRCTWGGFIAGVDQFDPLFFNISPREAEVMDPQIRLFLQTVWELLEGEGHTRATLQGKHQGKVGVYVGSMYQHYTPSGADAASQSLASLISYSAIANRTSHYFGLQGPSIAVDTMCSSSLTAVHLACKDLRLGECDLAIAGAVNLSINPKKYIGLGYARLLGSHSGCRSFAAGDGYLPAETVGALLLKPLSKAIADGDTVMAIIRSSAIKHGGGANGYTVPNPNLQAEVMDEVLNRSGISAQTVSCVEAAANGSATNDLIEVAALDRVFRRHTSDRQFCSLGSVKSNIGHAEAASGLSQLAKVILQMRNGMLAPSIGAEPRNHGLHLAETAFYLQEHLEPWRRQIVTNGEHLQEVPRRALINSFGAGGSYACLLLEEFPQTSASPIRPEPTQSQVITLSARNAERLTAVASRLLGHLDANRDARIDDIAYTLQLGREAMEARLAFVVKDREELGAALRQYTQPVQEGLVPSIIAMYSGEADDSDDRLTDIQRSVEALASAIRNRDLAYLAQHWVRRVQIPWADLHDGAGAKFIPLPTYPFCLSRYWFPDPTRASVQANSEAGQAGDELDSNPVEVYISRFLAKALGTKEPIRKHRSLHAYGVESILAMRLARALHEQFAVPVTNTILFECRTIANLAAYVEQHRTTHEQPAGPLAASTPKAFAPADSHPLSESQKGLWMLQAVQPDRSDYNVPLVFRLSQPAEPTALKAACDFVAREHPLLAAVIEEAGGLVYLKEGIANPSFALEDVSQGNAFDVLHLARELAQRPFDLEQGPLMRVHLLAGAYSQLLLIVTHHIVLDARSVDLLLKSLVVAYQKIVQGDPPESMAPAASYGDFVEWERNFLTGSLAAAQKDYWMSRLEGTLPDLKLPGEISPAGGPRPGQGLTISMPLSPQLSGTIRSFCAQWELTPAITFLAAYKVLLHHFSRQTDMIVGVPTLGRPKAEFDGVVGNFVNMVALRSQLAGEQPFVVFLRELQSTMRDALDHADYPFARIVRDLKLSGADSPIFKAVFEYKAQQLLSFAATQEKYEDVLVLEPVEEIRQAGQYRLVLEVIEQPNHFDLGVMYDPQYLDQAVCSGLLTQVQTLLASAVADPQQTISELSLAIKEHIPTRLASSIEKAEIDAQGASLSETVQHAGWAGPERLYGERSSCVHELFEGWADRTPSVTAVVLGDRWLSYGELNVRAERLAERLRRRGVGPEVLVGVCAERSLELVVGLLAVLKSGGAYVPLDPGLPLERLQYMLADSGLGLVVAQGFLLEKLEVWQNVEVLRLEEDVAEPALEPAGVPATSQNLAYMIYTSGSTGRPKGAMNTHRGIVNRLLWMQEQYGLEPGERVLQKTPFSFDVSVWEFFWPLLSGATIVLARPEGHRDAEYLEELIASESVTTVHFVPSMLEIFLRTAEGTRCGSLRRVICSGEALSAALVSQFRSRFSCLLHNLYGPTEAAVDVTYYECAERADGLVPIGRPVSNTRVYVLDGNQLPLPPGVAGELYLGGVQVGRGYWGRPELTAERFVPDPFGEGGARMYRTGDQGRVLVDGNLAYCGRLDSQVKLRGFRIELGEIESSLLEHGGVRTAAVTVRESEAGDRQLVGYVVPRQKSLPAGPGVRRLANGLTVMQQNGGETDFLYREIFESAVYSRHGMVIEPDACVFDVGANIGLFAMYASQRCPLGRIYCFEPLPPIYATLQANVVQCEAQVKVFSVGLAEEGGEAEFTYYRGNSIMSGRKNAVDRQQDLEMVQQFVRNQQGLLMEEPSLELLQERMSGESYRCPLRRLSEVMAAEGVEHIDLLKIDVERAEWQVLGGIDEQDWGRIDQVVLEVHDEVDALGSGQTERVVQYLRQRGFSVTWEEDEAMRGVGLYNVYATRLSEQQRAAASSRWQQRAASLPGVVTPASLRAHLQGKLPEYMVPAFFVLMDELPLSPSGKINRLALPAPKTEPIPVSPPENIASSRGTQSDAGIRLLTIWKALLQASEIDTAKGFFDMGGDSFLAVRLARKISEEFGFKFTVTSVFAYPTFASMASYLAAQLHRPDDSSSAAPEVAMLDAEKQATITDSEQLPNRYLGSVAIIGISCHFPNAQNYLQFWQNLRNEVESIEVLSSDRLQELGVPQHLAGSRNYVAARAALEGKELFDPSFFQYSPRDAEIMDPQLRQLLQHSWAAVEDAGYTPPDIVDAGVFMSASNNFYASAALPADGIVEIPEQYACWALSQPGTIPTVISYKLGLRGRSLFLHSNCSSSLIALEHAQRAILSGESKHALVGAATLFAKEQRGYLHQNGLNFSSDGHVRVFDAAADGMIGGEGVAVLLLKDTREAVGDGDHIYALLRGVAINNDGAEKTSYYAPSVKGQARVIEQALALTGIEPGSIGYIEAHGTGTRLGDPVEVAALTEAYGDNHGQKCALGSVKSNLGHLDSVAGLAGCIKTAFVLMEGEIPATLHFEKPNPELNLQHSPFYVPNTLTSWPSVSMPRRAAVSSFGIGGTNAHAILEQFQCAPRSAPRGQQSGRHLVPLSARCEERLRVSLQNLKTFLVSPSVLRTARPLGQVDLGDLAYTLQVGRVAMSARVMFIAQSTSGLIGQLEQYLQGVQEIPGCFCSAGRGNLEGLIEEEDASGLMEKWLAQGNLEKAGRMWVAGYDVPWRKLYRRGHFSRLALPTYPFAEESYSLHSKMPQSMPPVSMQPRLALTHAQQPKPSVDASKTMHATNLAATAAIQTSLLEIIATVTASNAGAIDADREWSQFGLDSVSLATLVIVVNDRYALDLAPTVFFEYPTPHKLAAYLSEHPTCVSAAEQARPTAQPLPVENRTHSATTGTAPASAAPGRQEPIAIIGMSGCFPQAEDAEALWQNLVQARSCIGEIPAERWDWREIYGDPATETNKTNNKWGAFLQGIAEFDPLFFGISPREAELMDPQQRLLMTHIWRVIEDAGYAAKSLAGSRTAIFVATSGSGYEGLLAQANVPIESYGFTGLIPSVGPSRMSYLLDLHGPSEPVETACSSSLVAIHRAVQSILNDGCTMAIAGGVNTIVSSALHISASKAGMLAEDGLCKTFSASANGFVRGEGVGMLLLKRLSDAERDGDQIHGVVLGSAENHGGRSNSLTAPSPSAQTQVIKMAHERAGVAPQTIGYIEAHGTGTALGDPIEINALKKAFAELSSADESPVASSAYCGVGSIKTNIGHLELAAGIAGIFKVLLQMKYKTLAKSLHSEVLNPYIQLQGSPFYIVQDGRPWDAALDDSGREMPRRAGISSFGIGGVNAHIVLEEYCFAARIDEQSGLESGPAQVILLSARNPERLREYAALLLRSINDGRFHEKDLPRVSYTLQTGRDAMEARLAMAVTSLAELKTALSRWLSGEKNAQVYQGILKRDRDRSAGSTLDEDLQKTIHAWMEKRNYASLMQLWVNGQAFDWQAMHPGKKPQRISLPTYPFAAQRYWPAIPVKLPIQEEEGLDPVRMPGRRNELHPLLHENTSSVAGLRYSTFLTGEESFFEDCGDGVHKVFQKLLFLEWARSAAILALLPQQVADATATDWADLEMTQVAWGQSLVINGSSLRVDICLRLVEPEEVEFEVFSSGKAVADGGHEDIVHCRGRARLLHEKEAAAIDLSVLQAAGCPLRESSSDSPASGPAWNLSPALLQGLLRQAGTLISQQHETDRSMDPLSLGSIKLGRAIADICWVYVRTCSGSITTVDADLCDAKGNVLVAISGLELHDRQREPFAPSIPAQRGRGEAGSTDEAMELLTFTHQWQAADPVEQRAPESKVLICFLNGLRQRQAVQQAARSTHKGVEILFVAAEDKASEAPLGHYTIRREEPASYRKVFEQIRKDRARVDGIFFMWAVEDRSFVHDYRVLIDIVRGLAGSGLQCATMLFAGRAFETVDECYLESWIAFEPSLRLVLPDTKVAVIYETYSSSQAQEADSWFARLWQELHAIRVESARYQEGQRQVCRTESLITPATATGGTIRQGGTYLITGGAGGLGWMFASHLARTHSVNLILTGRSALSLEKQRLLESLEELGGEAVYVQADVTDADTMRAGILQATRRLGPLRGVIHAAGVAGRLGILDNDIASFERVLQPKVQGTLVLDHVLEDQPLDFVCYFSSSSAVLGDFGGCDYAIANRFELAYAEYWNKVRSSARSGSRAFAICWPHWKDGGMGAGEENSAGAKFYLKSSGQRLLETQEGIELFYQLLRGPGCRHVVIAGQPSRARRFLGITQAALPLTPQTVYAANLIAGQKRRPELRGFTIQQCVQWDLKEVASLLLKISQEDLHEDENLADFGFDSIGLADFAQRLRAHFKIDITPSLFFSHPTLAQLGEYFMEAHGDAMESYYHEESGSSEPELAPARTAGERPVKKLQRTLGATAFLKTRESEAPEPIAIIGMSGRFPQARNVQDMWRILETGTHAVTEIPPDRFDWREFYGDPRKDPAKTNCKWGGCIPGISEFDPLFFEMSPREAEAMDPRQRLLLQEAWNALEDASYGPRQLGLHKVGMFVGVEQGDYQYLSGSNSGLVSSHDAVLAARLSYFLNLRGPVIALNTTCSSGLVAVHQACLSLRAGECTTALAAGVNLIITAYGYLAMGQAGMLSPDGRCYAFDHRANGMVPGEAVAVVVLKRLSEAIADGDRIYSVVRGSGLNYDGKTNGITAPSGAAQASLLRDVYHRARITPADIEYVVTHGTGTQLGDPVEINALNDVFRGFTDRQDYCAITSTKTNFGHTFAASGLVSLIGLIQSMRHQVIPASLHCERENEYIHWPSSPFYVNKANRAWPARENRGRLGAVSAWGMSGTNAHVVVESYEQPLATETSLPPLHLLALSAKSEAALARKIDDLLVAFNQEKLSLSDLHATSFTMLCGRHHFDHRCVMVAVDADHAVHLCRQAQKKEKQPNIFRGKVAKEFAPQKAILQYADDILRRIAVDIVGLPRYQELLYALGDLYCLGYDLDWRMLFSQTKPHPRSLPGYPFEREHYWATIEPEPESSASSASSQHGRSNGTSEHEQPARDVLERLFAGAMDVGQAKALLNLSQNGSESYKTG